eukprot:4442474-Prymnesium_polylepis.1
MPAAGATPRCPADGARYGAAGYRHVPRLLCVRHVRLQPRLPRLFAGETPQRAQLLAARLGDATLVAVRRVRALQRLVRSGQGRSRRGWFVRRRAVLHAVVVRERRCLLSTVSVGRARVPSVLRAWRRPPCTRRISGLATSVTLVNLLIAMSARLPSFPPPTPQVVTSDCARGADSHAPHGSDQLLLQDSRSSHRGV